MWVRVYDMTFTFILQMVWLETPINPTLNVVDIESISHAVHGKDPNVLVVVDNTFLTPVLQRFYSKTFYCRFNILNYIFFPFLHRPLDLGADVVVISHDQSNQSQFVFEYAFLNIHVYF